MFKSGFAYKTLALLALPTMASAAFNYWDVNDTSTVPKTLSATGLYTSITAKKLTLLPNAYHFDVNSALWSDGAHKTRWAMTKPGTSIGFDLHNDYWVYPDSTVFIKEFDIDTIPGDTTSRVRWETRFLVSRKESTETTVGTQIMDRWYGYSYKWNKDQLDGVRIDRKGKDDTIRVYPNGKAKPFVWKKWRFPGISQCNQCHRIDYADTLHGRSVLGFFTAQLNRPHPDSASINQLEYFFKHGLLTMAKGTKPTNWNASDVPKWASIDDNTASLDLRARSYIAANCSGCHGRRGMETGATFGVTLNYDFFDMTAQMEFRHRFVSWPFGLDTLQPKFYSKKDVIANPKGSDTLTIVPALVVPGYPNKSVILFRQTSRDTTPLNWDPDRNQMPPLASFEVNVPATTLISQWITAMTPIAAPNVASIRSGMVVRTLLKSPIIEGRTLRLPPELDGPGNVEVSLTGITGRTVELRQTGRGVYAIPAGLSAGVYQIKVGSQGFTRYLF